MLTADFKSRRFTKCRLLPGAPDRRRLNSYSPQLQDLEFCKGLNKATGKVNVIWITDHFNRLLFARLDHGPFLYGGENVL